MKLPVAVLAGGLATRMKPLTEKVPKSLLEVAGKPFAVHQLELLGGRGIDRVVFCVGYLGEQIAEALGDGRRWNLKIDYVFDGPVRLGTAGALKNALGYLGEAFLILYGDSYLECDYEHIGRVFLESRKLGLMTVLRNANQWDKSNIHYSDERILRYDKAGCSSGMEHIDYGLGALRAEALDKYPAHQPLDLVTVYQDLISESEMTGFEVSKRFYEIGSMKGLQETDLYLQSREQKPQ
jgi:NDP-sugar pyrophosphorylase family protein